MKKIIQEIKRSSDRYNNNGNNSSYRLDMMKVINTVTAISLFIYTFIFGLQKISIHIFFILVLFMLILSTNVFFVIKKKQYKDYAIHTSVGIIISLLLSSIFISEYPENALIWSINAPIILFSVYGSFFGGVFSIIYLLLLLLSIYLTKINFSFWAQPIALYITNALIVNFLLNIFDSLHFKTENLATFDKLTKIYNRDSTEFFLTQQQSLCTINNNFVLVFIDIDHFKKINDNYGHDIGDQVLKDFTKHINNFVRESDRLGRWGGEEFLLILSNTTLENSIEVINKIRKEINKKRFSDKKLKVTASFGIVKSCHKCKDINKLIKKADKAVYQAKENGRNKIYCHKLINNKDSFINVTNKK